MPTTSAADTNLDRWVDTRQLAAFINVSPRTVQGWRRRGDVGPPGSRLPNGQWRYKLSDADKWLRAHAR
jgi:phage terminase Nu1 subunit (DNA packaging protein)